MVDWIANLISPTVFMILFIIGDTIVTATQVSPCAMSAILRAIIPLVGMTTSRTGLIVAFEMNLVVKF